LEASGDDSVRSNRLCAFFRAIDLITAEINFGVLSDPAVGDLEVLHQHSASRTCYRGFSTPETENDAYANHFAMASQILALIQLHVEINGMEQQLAMSAMPHGVLLDVCKLNFFCVVRRLEADRL